MKNFVIIIVFFLCTGLLTLPDDIQNAANAINIQQSYSKVYDYVATTANQNDVEELIKILELSPHRKVPSLTSLTKKLEVYFYSNPIITVVENVGRESFRLLLFVLIGFNLDAMAQIACHKLKRQYPALTIFQIEASRTLLTLTVYIPLVIYFYSRDTYRDLDLELQRNILLWILAEQFVN
jgi:hypothetical protein